MDLLHEVRIAPTQTRTVPLQISQSKQLPSRLQQLIVSVTAVSDDGAEQRLDILLPCQDQPLWNSQTDKAIKGSYFFAESMPTAFLVLPPREPCHGESHPPILALRTYFWRYARTSPNHHISDGAGVRILEHSFWAESLPRQNKSWVVIPSGRTSWVWNIP